MNASKLTLIISSAVLLTAPALSQVASALLREGDIIGPTGEEVTSISNVATNNNGDFAIGGVFESLARGSDPVSFFYGGVDGAPLAILRTEGIFDSLTQNSFESFFGMAGDGSIAYSATVDGAPVTNADSVWVGDTNIMAEGQVYTPINGQFWRFGSRPTAVEDGTPWFVGGLTSTQGGSTETRGLFRGAVGSAVILEGDLLTGVPFPVNSISFDFRVSADGMNYIAEVDTTGPSTADGYMVYNGEALNLGGSVVAEGAPIPAAIGGLAGENWDNFDKLGVTNSGVILITGDSDASTSNDEFVLLDGEIILREGFVFPDGNVISGSIESAYLNEQGDWAVVWDVDLDSGSNVEALIVNGELVLLEGDRVDWDGNGIDDDDAFLANFSGIASLALSAADSGGGFDVFFTADVDDSGGTDLGEGAFRLTIDGAGCVGDISGNGVVDGGDLNILLSNWDCPNPADDCQGSDLTGDGDVDGADLNILLADFGCTS